MTQMLKLSDRGFKITMIIVLRALLEKADNMQKQMGNVSRDANSKKNVRGNVRIKKTHTHML